MQYSLNQPTNQPTNRFHDPNQSRPALEFLQSAIGDCDNIRAKVMLRHTTTAPPPYLRKQTSHLHKHHTSPPSYLHKHRVVLGEHESGRTEIVLSSFLVPLSVHMCARGNGCIEYVNVVEEEESVVVNVWAEEIIGTKHTIATPHVYTPFVNAEKQNLFPFESSSVLFKISIHQILAAQLPLITVMINLHIRPLGKYKDLQI